jgi:hypothetical protein
VPRAARSRSHSNWSRSIDGHRPHGRSAVFCQYLVHHVLHVCTIITSYVPSSIARARRFLRYTSAIDANVNPSWSKWNSIQPGKVKQDDEERLGTGQRRYIRDLDFPLWQESISNSIIRLLHIQLHSELLASSIFSEHHQHAFLQGYLCLSLRHRHG